MFTVGHLHNVYYIEVHARNLPSALIDESVAKLLKISYKEYCRLLILYGAFYDKDFGYIFDNQDSTAKFVDYLNNTYTIMLKLAGEI